ncbi:unnamed protein product [Spirodela intermedia]|uniref:Uncharacterized protein n=1 Tax=Spirodela intermedia TaxID=51605 RepID=A0A7I8J1X1_SPIIN|nr:unnamed protein product [Spirodela intermedia]CAA6664215.1 unnamed protein product [Spirodela intermedia]
MMRALLQCRGGGARSGGSVDGA